MGRRVIIAALVAYALIGIVTFGHSAAGQDRWYAQHCATIEQKRQDPGCVPRTPIGAFTAAILWPLYWSWEAYTPTSTIEQEI